LSKKKGSLRKKFALVFVLDFFLAALVFLGLQTLGTAVLDSRRVEGVGKVKTDNKEAELQDYIQENKLTTKDMDQVDAWVRKQYGVYLSIYRNKTNIYDSENYPVLESDDLSDVYYSGRYYKLKFKDATTDLYFLWDYDLQLYLLLTVGSLVLGVVVFLIVYLIFFNRLVRRIRRLESDVRVLAGGDLNYVIEHKGRDELTSLASELNQMRIALKENIELEETLSQANTRLVTSMAHDLRTPLTTLILYLELLNNKKYRSEEERDKYISKSLGKAQQIKHMSDQLFERFLIFRDDSDSTKLEEPQPVDFVLEDLLSDMIMYLESQGIRVETATAWEAQDLSSVKIAVVSDFITRIFDNISSNLLKYADRRAAVFIGLFREDGYIRLQFTNRIVPDRSDQESTQIGLINIRLMMEKMNGEVITDENASHFSITLIFPEIT
jgi:signal transduction histidine kinase